MYKLDIPYIVNQNREKEGLQTGEISNNQVKAKNLQNIKSTKKYETRKIRKISTKMPSRHQA
jgi:hypothetical protein